MFIVISSVFNVNIFYLFSNNFKITKLQYARLRLKDNTELSFRRNSNKITFDYLLNYHGALELPLAQL